MSPAFLEIKSPKCKWLCLDKYLNIESATQLFTNLQLHPDPYFMDPDKSNEIKYQYVDILYVLCRFML